MEKRLNLIQMIFIRYYQNNERLKIVSNNDEE